MATFLKNQRKKSKDEPTAVNGKSTELNTNYEREEKPQNNTTELEYMRSMFADLMVTMPITPVTQRPNRVGKQPTGSTACHLVIAANNANIFFTKSFNTKNATGCASMYMPGALMEARPNGMAFGRKMVEAFWKSVHDGSPGPLRYSNVRMRVVDEDTVTFASDWTMNTMRGIIMLETWRKLADGTFQLDEDRFKIEEVYSKPIIATPEQEVLGLQPLHQINEVMAAVAKRVDQFNAGDVDGFVNSYTENGLQLVDPLANSKGRAAIKNFAGFYITNRKDFGTGILSYNNFNVKVIDTCTVHVSGDWDLGEFLKGYMNIQKYVKQSNGEWLLELDDWTVAPTDFLY